MHPIEGNSLKDQNVHSLQTWRDVLEEARTDLQEALLHVLTRQPEGMQEFVSGLANLCSSLPAPGMCSSISRSVGRPPQPVAAPVE